jgi:hypothetical protein
MTHQEIIKLAQCALRATTAGGGTGLYREKAIGQRSRYRR